MAGSRFWLRNGWGARHAVLAAVMVALGVALTFEAWADILSRAWRDEENSHIFLVPAIAAWLVWVRRERFRYCTPTGGMLGPVLILLGAVSSYVGYYHAVYIAWHLGALLVVLGCLFSVVGADVVRRFLPAVVVLIFLIPVPGSVRQGIAMPLQGVLAQMTQFVFDVVGVPVERWGNALHINGVQVAIAEACNGLRMVFALVLVSYAFAFGTPLRNYVRLLIVAASPLSALAANMLRMIPTVWLYGWSNEELFGVRGELVAEAFHDVAGWAMLVVAFFVLMAIIRTLRWALLPVRPYTLAAD